MRSLRPAAASSNTRTISARGCWKCLLRLAAALLLLYMLLMVSLSARHSASLMELPSFHEPQRAVSSSTMTQTTNAKNSMASARAIEAFERELYKNLNVNSHLTSLLERQFAGDQSSLAAIPQESPKQMIASTPQDQQAMDVAAKTLTFRIQNSTVPRTEKSHTFSLELPLANTSGMPHWQQTILYKRAASERLARGGDAASLLPITPVSLHRLHSWEDDANHSKPVLSIITATRSHEEETAAQSDLQKRLIKSIEKTITEMEIQLWEIQLWIGVDDVDEWWVEHWHQLQAPDWLDIYIVIVPDKIHRVPFTEVAYASYTSRTPPDYLVRVNDDTEFLTKHWLTLAVLQLQSYDPPNVGVVGPECQAGNTMILTHDFVHATHMEIFQGYYYPTVFRNWYLDDWISTVYSDKVLGNDFHRKQVMVKTWKVKHWISASSYVPNVVDAQWLPTEYELGRRQIRDYVNTIDQEKGSVIPQVLPFVREFELLDAIQQYLPPDGNLLVWGFSMEESPSLHLATSGRVQFLGDDDPSRFFNMQVGTAKRKKPALEYIQGNYPFLSVDGEVLKTRGEWNSTFRSYFENQTFRNNSNWCDLQIPLFRKHLFASQWDVILVSEQGGVGANANTPGAGIFQPLFNSLILTGNQTATPGARTPHILIYNFDRSLERNTAQTLIGRQPDAVVLGNRLGVYAIGEGDQTFGWIPDCPRPLLRLPRAYIGPWDKKTLQKALEVIQTKDNVLFFGMKNRPQYWHFSTEGEVLFLENALNATRIKWLLDDHPEVSILPVNYTTHDVHEDRIAETEWNVLVLTPFERDQMAVFHEIERLRDIILKPGLKVIVTEYEVAEVRDNSLRLFGRDPFATLTRGPKKKQTMVAFFTLG